MLTLSRRFAGLGPLPLAKILHSNGKKTDVTLCIAFAVLALVQQVLWDGGYLDHLGSSVICSLEHGSPLRSPKHTIYVRGRRSNTHAPYIGVTSQQERRPEPV